MVGNVAVLRKRLIMFLGSKKSYLTLHLSFGRSTIPDSQHSSQQIKRAERFLFVVVVKQQIHDQRRRGLKYHPRYCTK